jgi:hypothetical protein
VPSNLAITAHVPYSIHTPLYLDFPQNCRASTLLELKQ